MDLRPLGPDDAAALAALDKAARPDAWGADVFANMLEKSATVAAGAFEGTQLCGYVLSQGAGDEAEILMIATHPGMRGLGIGRSLLDALTGLITAKGIAHLFLEVAEDNVPAKALYTRTGFREIGKRPGYYKRATGAVDAVLMRFDF